MEECALYIHIPFCGKKCRYCDFPSFCNKDHLMLEYAHALSKELLSNKKDNIFKTVFIGGGTPTYLSCEAWEIIAKSIRELKFSDNIEFTVECNPGTLDEEKLIMLRELRVNRLSIGLQAWQNFLLEDLGRIHKVEDFIRIFNSARRLGFDNINVDVMFGIPGQNLCHWEETLQRIAELNPEHISCYSLIVEEGTPFQALYDGGLLQLPEEDVERQMYITAVDFLKSNNYKQYEISNFSRPGRECRHNLTYWRMNNYLGCGSGAHSYVSGIRYRNEANIEKYIEMQVKKGCAVVESIKNRYEDEVEEFMFLGLRTTAGINETDFEKKFNKTVENVYGKVITKNISRGLLKRKGERLFLTARGIEFSNTVMSDFILDKQE